MRWRKHYKKTEKKAKHILRVMIIFLIICSFGSFVYMEFHVRPRVDALTRVKAQALATEAVNAAVTQQLDSSGITYGDLMNIKSKSDSTVVSISTNVVEVNKLKSEISLLAQQKINEMSNRQICFKAGDLSGFSLLSGIGPDVTVHLNFSSSILTNIESSFESAGVNQTRHIVQVQIKANVYISSQSIDETTLEVDTNIPIAENVIVGSVPSLYTGSLVSGQTTS